ncbi:MAG: hypothetical protein K8H87_01225 [Pseudorhodoplanes sp.]|nr:hypothetical protein [Pseudorhodoplanes sp.]
MTAKPADNYIRELEQVAQAANVAEEAYRNEAMRRIREFEQERAFAFRRLNLLRSLSSAVLAAKDQEEAAAHGTAALLRELNWTGANDPQREVVNRFLPVITALWQTGQSEDEVAETPSVAAELSDFEKWFATNRDVPFLSLMEVEVQELPLVEV